MPALALGTGTLRRLSRLDAGGLPLLSLYLDLDGDRFPTPDARDVELAALLAQAGPAGGGAERVRELLRVRPQLMRDAPGLAVFAAPRGGPLEAVALPQRVEPMIVVDTLPWLEPLTAMTTVEHWGVAIVTRSAARLLRGGPRSLVEFQAFGCGAGQSVAAHARRAAQRLLCAHRRHAFEHLVVAAADDVWPTIAANLHRDLRARLTSQVAAPLEHAATREIAAAVAPAVQAAERVRERAPAAPVLEERGSVAALLRR